ncbi:hypothetical protein KJ855_04300 [Patescibacteria group bacterium]|nr:hypothetical protein [Patescibacteria group bacterium]
MAKQDKQNNPKKNPKLKVESIPPKKTTSKSAKSKTKKSTTGTSPYQSARTSFTTRPTYRIPKPLQQPPARQQPPPTQSALPTGTNLANLGQKLLKNFPNLGSLGKSMLNIAGQVMPGKPALYIAIITTLLAGGATIAPPFLAILTHFASYGPGGSSEIQIPIIAAQVHPVSTPTGHPGGTVLDPDSPETDSRTTFEYIENASEKSVSGSFKNWAGQIKSMDEEINSLAYDTIIKTDTSEETIELLKANADIVDNIIDHADSVNQDNDEPKYYRYLRSHYLGQDSVILELADFNEIFEYLLIQTGEGAEINGSMADDKQLRQSRQNNLPEMLHFVTSRKIKNLHTFEADDQSISNTTDRLQNQQDIILATLQEETKERDEKFPPALEFANPDELYMLLPQTKADYEEYAALGYIVDSRVYYLLNYIFHVLEMTGEDYDTYIKDILQEPETPQDIEDLCGDKLENDPEKCNKTEDKCGVKQILYAADWLNGDLDNLGVPYKDRAHLKIWLGLDAPLTTDELPQDFEKTGKDINNTHYFLRAIDIMEIGLYNERLDCAACQGLDICPSDPSSCLLLEDPPKCCPFTPITLDLAQDEYKPVEIKWSHSQIGLDVFSSITDTFSNILANPNNFSPQSIFGENSLNQFNNIFHLNIDPGTYNFGQISNTTTHTLLNTIANFQINSIYSTLGLPQQTIDYIFLNNQSPNTSTISLASGYVNELYQLFNHSFSIIQATKLPAQYQAEALELIYYTPNTHLSPNILTNLINSISSDNNSQAISLSLANLGIQEINHSIFTWIDDVIDPKDISNHNLGSITSRLNDLTLNRILGLPTNYHVDPDNPKITYSSKSAAILSEVFASQKINYYVSNQIANNQTADLFTALQTLNINDINQLFANPESSEMFYSYITNNSSYPGGHNSFLNDLYQNTDTDYLETITPYLEPNSIQTIIQKGTSQNIGDEFALASISASIILDRIGVDLTYEDSQKIPYLLEYIALDNIYNLNPGNTNLPFSIPGFHPPEITQLESKYYQDTGSTESLASFRQRLIDMIYNSSLHQKITNQYLYTIRPIKITSRSFINQLSEIEEYQDNSYITSVDPTYGFQTPQPLPNLLNSVGIDIADLTIISEQDFLNNQVNPVSSMIPNQIYYAYPKINLPEIIFPGIGPSASFRNNLGAFLLLDYTTNIIDYSQTKPIEISTTAAFPGILPPTATGEPLLLAMQDKYTTSQTDILSPYGGTEFIYRTIFTPTDYDTTIKNLALIGNSTLSHRINGTDPITGRDLNSANITDIINTMIIIQDWINNNTEQSKNEIITFVTNNQIFTAGKDPSSDINQIIDFINQNNFFNQISQILTARLHYQDTSDLADSYDFNNFIEKFVDQPFLASTLSAIKTIISDTISTNGGLDKKYSFSIVSPLIENNPQYIYKLLSLPDISRLLPSYHPQYLIDIQAILSAIATNQTNYHLGLYMISAGNLINQNCTPDKYPEFIQPYDNLLELTLSVQNKTDYQNLSSRLVTIVGSCQNSDSTIPLLNLTPDEYTDDAAMEYLQQNILSEITDDAKKNELINQIKQLLQGKLTLPQAINLTTNFINTFDPSGNPQAQQINQRLRRKKPKDFPSFNFNDTPPPNIIFEKCRQKIAQDNLVHLSDIIISFYKNKRTLNYYEIDYDSDGELLDEDQPDADTKLSNFFPHQIFSDFIDDIVDIITDKAVETFDYVWPKDDTQFSQQNLNNDIWVNDCADLDNEYLSTCQEYIHVSF